MISSGDIAERASEYWYSTNPKYRTRVMFQDVVEAAIKEALKRYEDGEMIKVQ